MVCKTSGKVEESEGNSFRQQQDKSVVVRRGAEVAEFIPDNPLRNLTSRLFAKGAECHESLTPRFS
jgi:hypothetical protein